MCHPGRSAPTAAGSLPASSPNPDPTGLQDPDGPAAFSAAAFLEAVRIAGSATATQSLHVLLGLTTRIHQWETASVLSPGDDGLLRVVAHHGDDPEFPADLHCRLDQGPAVDAFHGGATVHAPDLAAESRWAHWTPHASRAGVAACLAVQLHTNQPLGVLVLSDPRPRHLTGQDHLSIGMIAAHASLLLTHARTEEQMHRAVQAHNRIGQAQGILMERYKMTPDAAFAFLTRTSQNTNTKISALADELATTGRLPAHALNDTLVVATAPTVNTRPRTQQQEPAGTG